MASGSTPKMKDVAKRCGVSESTVSHVLNGTKFVSEATRKRVLAAVERLGYHRDAHARRLASGQSNFLGLIISDIENPFFPGLIKGFESAALEAGFEMLLCTTDYSPQRTEAAFRKMIENKSPGVAVMTSRVAPEMGVYLAEHGVASVFLDSDSAGPRKCNVRIDYRTGTSQAVRHLYELGHRDFALIAGPQMRASHLAYRIAVESALGQFGVRAAVIESTNDAATGETAVKALLAMTVVPTAVLCSNDLTAMSVCSALARRGVSIPGDVSIVGADDIPFAALTQPPLTTVRMPRTQLGTLALDTLRDMIGNPGRRGSELTVGTDLIVRESSGRARVFGIKRRR